ncbi:MAG: protein-S-isoprenylcysteine O-methyltransferase [Pseudomonadota bacterium]
MNRQVLRSFAMAVLIAIVLAGAAAWRGALTPGIVMFLASTLALLGIRAQYTSDPLPIASRHRQVRETFLLQLVAAGMSYLPAIAIATPLLDFANYATPLWVLGLGAVLSIAGLWLFWRSHADLGQNWSVTLELRSTHKLVTRGVYSRIRHPMYSAIFLIAAAQAAFLGNWIAGPAGFFTFTVLYLDRVRAEEQMMAERFGTDWTRYAARTGRLLPTAARNETGSAA